MPEGVYERKRSEQDASSSGRTFDAFPYPPYDIQQQFMAELFDTLATGGIGLFESPTGTGKTLSLICGALSWLEEVQQKEQEATKAVATDVLAGQEAMPAWMSGFKGGKESRKETKASNLWQDKGRQQQRATSIREGEVVPMGEGDESFALQAWESDGEERASKRRRLSDGTASSESDSGEEEEPTYKPRQIYFCSRTHSQLSQFVGELKRTRYAGSVSLAALASRQALCINEDVLKLRSAAQITERCLNLQKPLKEKKLIKGKKASSSCPFLKSKSDGRKDLREHILREPMDVEDLSRLGKRKAVCPYYASRSAVPEADLVLLPYSGLLSQETRDALGVKLAGNVVIVDEAHNLVSAVNSTHSASISSQQLRTAHEQLSGYYQRFQSLLAPGNDENIQMLMAVVQSLLSHLENLGKSSGSGQGSSSSISKVNNFLFATGLDNINIFRLVRYAKESKVLFKVAGFSDSRAQKEAAGIVQIQRKEVGRHVAAETMVQESQHAEGGTGALLALMAFLRSLNNRDADGRIVTDGLAGSFKFVLLNAASHFSEVLEQAHAVILASGTLTPIASLQRQLFPGKAVRLFSCGHVVPKERLLAVALGAGPSKAPLDFRHTQRSSSATIDQLGRLLINVCNVVPQGVVVFFPSFSYAEQVLSCWKSTNIMSQLAAKKSVFTEPQSASQVEPILREYAGCILGGGGNPQGALPEKTGAILMCVVGGKMSEGINFGDGLGRCVVMVGMPYPNPHEPELQERMRYLDLEEGRAQEGKQIRSYSPGQEYYDDLCMKAVNQCIGRVVRHKGDWAAILLVDCRWAASSSSSEGTRQKLPAWIKESFVVADSFGDGFAKLVHFCRAMSSKHAARQ